MSHALKPTLITFLSNLDSNGLSIQKKQEIADIISYLSRNNIQIPDHRRSENEIEHFIALVFSTYPALMNAKNKIELEHYMNNSYASIKSSTHQIKK